MAYRHPPFLFSLVHTYLSLLFGSSWLRHSLSIQPDDASSALFLSPLHPIFIKPSINLNNTNAEVQSHLSSLIMACSSPSITLESYESPSSGQSSCPSPLRQPLNPRRRHSSYHSLRQRSQDLNADATFMKARFSLPRRTEATMLIYR